MTQQEKVTQGFTDDLEKQNQSPLDIFKDALKGGDRADKQVLLDDFAKAAMRGLIASHPSNSYLSPSNISEKSYDIATAMMRERERRMKG